MENEIINRVAKSPILSINLEDFIPEGEKVMIDIKDQLFHGLILREKDFREFVKTHDWNQYKDSFVTITCSADAIIPTWAYMLIASKLEPFAKAFVFGNEETLNLYLILKGLQNLNLEEYRDKPVVIKGCFDKPIPTAAYVEITRLLTPLVKSLMFGEPCSTVPIYKRKT